ncbi:hypothetical protein GBAR_LOCUS24907 [Geodia barretti]|uniref:Uncharacterized protein n=1 Tax=Geodia barretti TaxID=519541 RepID=A0AA35TB04_GEOBA|nr:hypothetical protein GBAR_LOCUS24907 [Geodia barretti]
MCHCLFLLPLTHTHTHTHSSFLLSSLPLSHQAATVPLLIASRGTQIYSLYRLKSVGDVSISMFVLSSYASAARLFTIAVEVKDLQIFFMFVLSLFLNLTVVVQCFYYGRSATSHQQKKKTN